MRGTIVVIAAVFLLGAAGCEFANSGRKKHEAATTAEIKAVHDEVARLRVEVEALEHELARSDKALRVELQGLSRAVSDLDAKSARRVAEAKSELAAKINEIERKRVSDKNALNAKMDAIVAQVRNALGGARGGGPSGATRTEKGFYHTVKEGETVSGIAGTYRDEYGTTTKAILDANNLTATSIIPVSYTHLTLPTN